MCEMSNRPATLRTARCSSRIDVYCCGNFQPPKSTMRPPRATWREQSGVLRAGLGVKLRALVFVVGGRVGGLRVDNGERLVLVSAPRARPHLGAVCGSS